MLPGGAGIDLGKMMGSQDAQGVMGMVMSSLTQGMSEEEKRQFEATNKMMFESMTSNSENNFARIYQTAWEDAKVRHIESLGGLEMSNPESELVVEELSSLRSIGLINKPEWTYIVCGDAIMKVGEQPWKEFLEGCKDQTAALAKFVDNDWIKEQIKKTSTAAQGTEVATQGTDVEVNAEEID